MPDGSFDLLVFGRSFRVKKAMNSWELMIIGRDGKLLRCEDIIVPSFVRNTRSGNISKIFSTNTVCKDDDH